METKTAQHTPGPWSKGYTNDVKTESGRLIAHCFPENGTLEQLHECWANARLIAAAPDYHAAVRKVFESSESMPADMTHPLRVIISSEAYGDMIAAREKAGGTLVWNQKGKV